MSKFSQALTLIVALTLSAPAKAGERSYIGYVEAEYVRAASASGGRLTAVEVTRGRTVTPGQVIARLDDTFESAQVREAQARLAQAEAQLTDLESARRKPEIDAIESQRRQAEAQLKLSQAQVERNRVLAGTGAASRRALDEAVMAVTRDQARVRELSEQLTLARSSTGRDSAIAAARANIESARAALEQAQWRLGERTIKASAGGTVSDVIYRPGEIIPAGGAVALIISPDFTKARFYVPQRDLTRVAFGQAVQIQCDGCDGSVAARVSYVAPDAEFTPPVIFSDQTREKLVFMIEARAVDGPLPIAPGRPVTVTVSGERAP